MINTLSIYEDLRQCLGDEAARKLAGLMGKLYEEIAQTVTKQDFNELTRVVSELAEAQKRTEARVEELAEAQRRTEERVEELAEAQKRTEQRLDSLTLRVEELAEAQKRTEARVEELAEAQRRTEQRLDSLTLRVEELAEAQRRTEESLGQLIKDHSETRKRLESMSDAIGYNLENQSYKSLPNLLLRDDGIRVDGRLIRRYFPGKRKGQYLQANIYGWGKKNGDRVLILGEAKTSISRKEINRFQKLVKQIATIEELPSEKILQVIVVHDITPTTQEYAKEKGIRVYWSYEL